MSLSSRNLKDSMLWYHTKPRIYTTKSAYHLIQQGRQSSQANMASSSGSPNWKWLWKIMIPPKVKIFTWRLLYRLLLSSGELIRRRVIIDGVCRKCGESVETSEHDFRDCMWSVNLWYLSCLRIIMREEDRRASITNWIHEQRRRLPA